MTLWDNSGTPDDAFVTHPAQVVVKGIVIKEPVWVDLVSGRIYEIPVDRITNVGESTTFKDIPLYDAPVLLAEKGLVINDNTEP